MVATVARNQPRECAPRQKVHELSEQRLAGVHAHPWKPPGRVRESVQIDTTKKRWKILTNRGLTLPQPSFTGQQ
jgi:hypothetical protein